MIFDLYMSFYNISGIFVDEMANTQERLPYYEKLYEYIKNVRSDLKVIGNPGMPYTLEGYLRAADTLVIFEGSSALYADFRPVVTAPWVVNYPRERFANIVYAAESSTDMIRRSTRLARLVRDRFSSLTADCRTLSRLARLLGPGGCGDSGTRPDCGIAGKAKAAGRFQGSTR